MQLPILLSQIQPNVTVDQVISVFVVALVLNWLGSRVCREEPKLQQVSRRIGVAAFVVLFSLGVMSDGGGAFMVTRLTQSGLIASFLTGFLLVALPYVTGVLSLVWSVVAAPFRFIRGLARKLRDRRLAKQKAEEWERGRPERERLARLQAQQEASRKQEAAAAERQKKTEQQRRDDARYNLRLIFQRHYTEIKESMSRKRFEDLIEREMSDALSADVVERKAKRMEEMIFDFFEQVVPEHDHDTVDDLRDTYEIRRDRITDSDFDDETKAALLAQLKWEEDQAARKMKK